MRLRGMYYAVLVLTLLIGALTAAQARVIARDVAYWYLGGEPGVLDTMFNPDSRWLKLNRGKLVIKVQQTVYDERQTAAILTANLPKPILEASSLRARSLKTKSLKAKPLESTVAPVIPTGFLYSYAVTNLNWRPANATTGFAVNWGGVPVLWWTTSRTQTPLAWKATVLSKLAGDPIDGPAWLWTNPAKPWLRVGSTVGGFWAVAPTATDGIVDAWTGSTAASNPGTTWILAGKTTGPIPEPASAVTLVVGAAALGLFRLRRR